MGSTDSTIADLPAATAPSVVLAHPSDEEQQKIWALTATEWAGALTQAQYLEREPYLTTVPLNRDGGITHWILTTNDNNGNDNDADAGSGRSRRPLLSSCESYKKIVLVADPGSGQVREEIGHGIGSVFTSTEYRGRSYASRMLGEVGTKLANWDLSPSYKPAPGSGSGSSGSKKAICSALWSDIGKKFYAKKGWIPFASQHVEFAACKGEQHGAAAKLPSTPITYANLAKFCAIDEAAVRSKLVKTAAATGKTAMAFAPSHDQMLWHLYRDSYIASIVLPDRDPSLAADVDGQPGNATAATNGTTAKGRESPASSSSSSSPSRQPRSGAALRRHPGAPEANEVKGIAVGPEGRRVWAIWTRNYATPAGPDAPQKNTLYILRLVVENEDEIGKDGDGEAAATTTEAFRAVIRAAQAFAAEWGCAHVDLWNPTGVVARLLRDSGLEHEVVEREEASIPSLMWYGEGTRTEDVVWVNNEKYCWC